jgi:hypothetical protein
MSFTPQALNYFPSQTDAQNSTNVIFQDTSFTITDRGGYSAWLIDTTNTSSSSYNPNTLYTSSSSALNPDGAIQGSSAKYFLYPAVIVYYYNSETAGYIQQIQLGFSTSYTITTVGGYSNWVILNNNIGASPPRIVYTSGQTLNPVGTYLLFPESPLWYYATKAEAESRTNAIANSASGTGETAYRISSLLVNDVVISKWFIGSNSTGSSSTSVLYTAGQTLNIGGQYFLYYRAPSLDTLDLKLYTKAELLAAKAAKENEDLLIRINEIVQDIYTSVLNKASVSVDTSFAYKCGLFQNDLIYILCQDNMQAILTGLRSIFTQANVYTFTIFVDQETVLLIAVDWTTP